MSPNNCAFERGMFLKVRGYCEAVCEDGNLAVRFFKMFGENGARYRFDGSATVLISDRRLVRRGIFMTLLGWVATTIGILMDRDRFEKVRHSAVR